MRKESAKKTCENKNDGRCNQPDQQAPQHLVVIMGMVTVDNEPLSAITTFHLAAVLGNGEPNPRMPQRTLIAVTSNFPLGYDLGFRSGAGH
jgi:hypothetical protein